jgi:uncharacterized protein
MTKGKRGFACMACLLAGTALAVLMLAGQAPARAFSQTEVEIPDDASLIDPSQIPSVHNSFYQVPDGVVSWDVLGNLDVTTEVLAPLQVRFHTDYSDEIKALDAQDVQLMGFLYPLEGGLTHARFLLTAWPPSCPFCLPAGPTQMVEVFCAEPVEFTEGAILMSGRFEVLKDDPTGLYYRMHDAELVQRFDDIRWTGQLSPPAQPAPK